MNEPTPTPPLVDVIAGVLRGHYIGIDPRNEGLRCECGQAVPTDDAAHQARAVLDALTKAGGVEWGIRYGDGDIDGGYLHKSEAQEDIEKLRERVRLGASPAEGNEPMTLLTRRNFEHAGPWAAVEGS